MRIAFFSPLNPVRSGISDYSEELLPELSRYADIDIYVHQSSLSNSSIRSDYQVYEYNRFFKMSDNYQVCLYQMGNSPCHRFVWEAIKRRPGVTVLHDYVLQHFFSSLKKWEYLRVLKRSYGSKGLKLGLDLLGGVYGPRGREQKYYEYPLNQPIIDKSLGLIVHSNNMRDDLSRENPGLKIAKINQHYAGPSRVADPEVLRLKYGFGPGDFVIGSFGYITPSRRIGVVLRAFRRLRKVLPSARYVLVGEAEPSPDFNLSYLIERYGVSDWVRVPGFVDMDTFFDYLSLCDVCVNLRYPSAGEVSAALIRIMGMGKPVLISDYAQYREFPDDCCVKVDLGEYEVELVYRCLRFLAENVEVREKMGENARNYILENHTVESSAKAYMSFIEECLRYAV